MYIVDVGIPVEDDADWQWALDFGKNLGVVAEGYGAICSSSGAGFGFRDIQFEVGSRRKARQLQAELKKILSSYETAYVGCEWAPKSNFLMVWYGWNWKEAFRYLFTRQLP